MDLKEMEQSALQRRCNSEPPLLGNRPTSTFTQRTAVSSSHSAQNINADRFPKQKVNTTSLYRGQSVIRSSTFPILPSLNHTNRPQQTNSIKPISHPLQQEKLPAFNKNHALYNKEKIIGPHQHGLEGRKFQLRSRFIEIREPTPPKEPPSPGRNNLLRKRVQEIGHSDHDDTNVKYPNGLDIPKDEVSQMFLTTGNSNVRRLSVITEKSAFSKTSKTLLLDLEDQNSLNKPTLPAVGKTGRKNTDDNNNCWESNSKKLQEHLQITEKQFDPIETKATLLSNWFQTLQTG